MGDIPCVEFMYQHKILVSLYYHNFFSNQILFKPKNLHVSTCSFVVVDLNIAEGEIATCDSPAVCQHSSPAAGNHSALQPGKAGRSGWRCGNERAVCYG